VVRGVASVSRTGREGETKRRWKGIKKLLYLFSPPPQLILILPLPLKAALLVRGSKSIDISGYATK